jgi:hypothetical protein
MPTTITGTSISVPGGGITRGSLPSGSVIQTQITTSSTRVGAYAASFAEASSNYRVTITHTRREERPAPRSSLPTMK